MTETDIPLPQLPLDHPPAPAEQVIRTEIAFASSPDVHDVVVELFKNKSEAEITAILDNKTPFNFGDAGYTLMWEVAVLDPEPAVAGDQGKAHVQYQQQNPIELRPIDTHLVIFAPLGAKVRLALAGHIKAGEWSLPVCFEFVSRPGRPGVQSPGAWIVQATSMDVPRIDHTVIDINGKNIINNTTISELPQPSPAEEVMLVTPCGDGCGCTGQMVTPEPRAADRITAMADASAKAAAEQSAMDADPKSYAIANGCWVFHVEKIRTGVPDHLLLKAGDTGVVSFASRKNPLTGGTRCIQVDSYANTHQVTIDDDEVIKYVECIWSPDGKPYTWETFWASNNYQEAIDAARAERALYVPVGVVPIDVALNGEPLPASAISGLESPGDSSFLTVTPSTFIQGDILAAA